MSSTGSRRVVGVDTARGLAVLGMFVAHLGMERHTDFFTSTGWFFLADGRPSALFALLAGTGLVFMTQRAHGDRDQLAFQRSRIIKRALILYGLGYLLLFLGTAVAVILPAYAVLFLLALPFLRMSAPALLGVAAGVFVVGPVVLISTRYAITGEAGPVGDLAFLPGLAEVWSGYYPAITWLGYILVGLAIGKMDLRSRKVGAALLVGGAAVAVIAYGAGALAERAMPGGEGTFAYDLVTIEPHANTAPEMIGNAAFGVALVGLCLLAMSIGPLRVLATPINAIGAMSLSIYTLHIVYIAILGNDAVWYPTSNWPLIALVIGSMVFATVWRLTLGQGPLERLLARLAGPKEPPSGGGGAGTGPPPYASETSPVVGADQQRVAWTYGPEKSVPPHLKPPKQHPPPSVR